MFGRTTRQFVIIVRDENGVVLFRPLIAVEPVRIPTVRRPPEANNNVYEKLRRTFAVSDTFHGRGGLVYRSLFDYENNLSSTRAETFDSFLGPAVRAFVSVRKHPGATWSCECGHTVLPEPTKLYATRT